MLRYGSKLQKKWENVYFAYVVPIIYPRIRVKQSFSYQNTKK